MFAKTYLCLAAAAASAVSGFSLPDFGQFAVDSGLALAGLNSIAVLNSLANTQGACNVGNLKFRQEWYETPFSQHPGSAPRTLPGDLV
jgi:tyrosinase